VITLDALNRLPVDEFTATLGAIFEHSPWVPRRAAAARPFASRLDLLDAMRAVVEAAPVEEQLGLIRAHPQLGARGRKRAELTEASSREQRRAGLDACTDEEFEQLLRLNAAYVRKFSFPFILAVRGHDPNSILASMGSRLNNSPECERHTALTQIGLIAGYRLADIVASPAGAEIKAMSDRLSKAAAADSAAGRSLARTATAANSTAAATSTAAVDTARVPARTSAVTADSGRSLLREWMLAANLDLYTAPDGSLVGVQHHDPSAKSLLTGVHSDPTTGTLRSDGSLGSLPGIAVAQQIRQKGLATRFNLCVLAPSDSANIDPLVPLRSLGLSARYEVYTGQPTVIEHTHDPLDLRSFDPPTLERAAQTLETFLTQPPQIQE
jgi:2-oxo-4-hydroxy-4-carboxy-5-ureidoimidazoline decarboxylase